MMETKCKICGTEYIHTSACPRCGFHATHRGFQGAWRRGATTMPPATCPYPDKRGGEFNHVVTFSRAYQRFWQAGQDWIAAILKDIEAQP